MVAAKISKVREIVSHIVANESVVSYLGHPMAKDIQRIVKEMKRDCLIFYSLGDDHFDLVFLSTLCDVSSIAERKK